MGRREEPLFGLSPAFFDGARICHAAPEAVASVEAADDEVCVSEQQITAEGDEESRLSRWTCGSCDLKFQTGEEQRSHFKSDFHRLNVKRKLAGKSCFNEDEFEKIADGNLDCDVSSVSGSDDESEEEEEKQQQQQIVKSKQIPILLSTGSLGQVWRCLLLSGNERLVLSGNDDKDPGAVSEEELLSRLKALVASPKLVWVVLLAVGGHFAGVVVDIKTGAVQAHQTYHRYVVRAKAGGKQSSRDGTGRAPKSAGASLRRYNEMALNKEMKKLLESWAGYLREAGSIFVFAPSRNSQSLFGEKPLLDRGDPRVRQVPFTTKRPTYKEARRVYSQLSLLMYKERETSSDNPAAGEKPEAEKTKSSAKKSSSKRESSEVCVEEAVVVEQTPALHEAAMRGDASLVTQLLEQGADPCLKFHARTAYASTSDKDTRNAFRKFMAAHLDSCDWNAAGVPSALTDEMEAAQAAKQAEKNAKRRAKDKERKKEKKAHEQATQASKAAAAVTAQQEAKNEVTRQRELRAAAAESRVKGSLLHPISSASSESCSCCSASLANKVPFYKFNYKYCSVTCVNTHKRDE